MQHPFSKLALVCTFVAASGVGVKHLSRARAEEKLADHYAKAQDCATIRSGRDVRKECDESQEASLKVVEGNNGLSDTGGLLVGLGLAGLGVLTLGAVIMKCGDLLAEDGTPPSNDLKPPAPRR